MGPTGSGKTALSLAIAERFAGEIVNCDSLQLYRYLDIGTAKVRQEERRGIVHHLFDILEPDEVFTAGDYIRLARPVLIDIAQRGRLPVVTGGTGFYFRALLHGLFKGPGKNDELRERLARKPARLHGLLTRLDPASAARIHAHDTQKLIRALEVCVLSRQSVSSLHQEEGREPLSGFRVLTIGLDPPRDALSRKLDARTSEMFASGLREEIEAVLARGFPPQSKAFEAIGYREALLLRTGQLTYSQAIEQAQASTRQYAKRQRTWFRREPGVHWLRQFGDQTETIETAICLIEEHKKIFQ